MKTNLNIYQMILSASDFVDLDAITENLRKVNYDRIRCINSICGNVTHEIAKAVLDLKEAIDIQNKRGYRYNSYLLNSAILKLNFAYEVIKGKEVPTLKTEEDILSVAIKSLHGILISAWETKEANSTAS